MFRPLDTVSYDARYPLSFSLFSGAKTDFPCIRESKRTLQSRLCPGTPDRRLFIREELISALLQMASRAAAAPPALTEEGVKLLFLDLDGVICCNYHGELEADKLALVGKIVEETGCRVVLSTDWRRQPHLRTRAEETLSGYGVTCIGATPQYPMYARVRPKEILAWMVEYNGPIAAWCALDDRDLVLEEGGAPAFINHFVLTEFATGLTEPLAQRVIDRIGRGGGDGVSGALSASPADRWKPQPWPPSASGGVLAASAVFLGAASSGSSAPPETAAPDPPPLRSVQALLRESSLWHREGSTAWSEPAQPARAAPERPGRAHRLPEPPAQPGHRAHRRAADARERAIPGEPPAPARLVDE